MVWLSVDHAKYLKRDRRTWMQPAFEPNRPPERAHARSLRKDAAGERWRSQEHETYLWHSYRSMPDAGRSEFYDYPDLYDALLPVGAEVPFYIDVARQQGGAVLELACGTGQ